MELYQNFNESITNLTLNTLLDVYIKDDANGFFDAINILKDGINKAINNSADELKLIKDTKQIALQFLSALTNNLFYPYYFKLGNKNIN